MNGNTIDRNLGTATKGEAYGAVFLYANYYPSGNVKNQTQFNFYGGLIGSNDGKDGNQNIASDKRSVFINYVEEIPTSTIDIKGIFNMYKTNGICGMIKYNYKGSEGNYSKAGISLSTKDGDTIGTYSDYHIDSGIDDSFYEIETKKP